MLVIQRTLYLVGLLAWVSYMILNAILNAPWSGRIYNEDVSHPGTFYEGGTFGLRGGSGPTVHAPVWDPPKPFSDATNAEVRWPWQPVRKHEHVEIRLVLLASQLSLGILVLGLILRVATWFTVLREPDPVLSVAWSLSLSLLISWLCIWAILVFTAGHGLGDGIFIAIFMLGVVGGCVYGVLTYRRGRSSGATASAASDSLLQENAATGAPGAQRATDAPP